MKQYLKISFSFLLTISFFISACQHKKTESPPGYDFNNPEKFRVPSKLLEISGISFYKGNSETIYAIQDEDGKLFRMTWGNKNETHTKFGKKGDYEDLTIINEKVFVLKSNGTIYSFPLSEANKEDAETVSEWEGLIPKGEYEAMYGDETTGKLYILCKNCDNDKKKTSGYIIDIKDSVFLSSGFSIDEREIKAFGKKLKSSFRPSALAKNPLTGDWFILSAVNKILVITDINWKVKAVYHLSGNTFNQPEGIAFDAGGNLYISNEGDDYLDGNILKFVRQN